MSKPVNSTLIGAFVIGAIVLISFAIIAFGGQGLFAQRERVIMYFSGSVDGLNIGAPVNVRGVKVGTVTDINIEFNTQTGELRVPVIAEIDANSVNQVRQLQAEDPMNSIIQELGLRAQLQIQSILTSQLFIQLDYHPDTEIQYYGDGSMIEIPTIPMLFEQLDRAMQDISIEQMMVDLTSSLTAINRLVNSPDLMDSINAAKQAFDNFEQLSTNLNDRLVTLADNSNQTMLDISDSLDQMRELLDSAKKIIAEDSPHLHKLDTALDEISSAARTISNLENLPQMQKLDIALVEISEAARTVRTIEDSPQMYNFNTALDEIISAARSIRILADTLEQHPEAIFRGKVLREE